MLIALAGLPGTGKSTLARGLALALGATWLRIDVIEQALRESGSLAGGAGPAGYMVGYALAEANLALGLTVIADSVNPLAITRQAWRDVATRAGSPIREVALLCSDPAEHRRRVKNRPIEVAGLVSPDWQAVQTRETDPWDRAPLRIETAGRDPDAILAEVLDALRNG